MNHMMDVKQLSKVMWDNINRQIYLQLDPFYNKVTFSNRGQTRPPTDRQANTPPPKLNWNGKHPSIKNDAS